MSHNLTIDTDILSAAFVGPPCAGHLYVRLLSI
jgi:hypothetical protein